jgi:uncharacterized membrane protein
MNPIEWTPFSAWPWIVLGTTMAFLAVAWFTLRSSKGPGLKQRILWLALRGALFVLLLTILLHPHRVERKEFREPLDLAVLMDNSASMSQEDEPGRLNRLQQLKTQAAHLNQLKGDGVQLRWYSFAGDTETVSGYEVLTANQSHSKIGKALETVLGDDRERELGAAILISDGQADVPSEARKAAELYKQANIPLYTCLMGTPDDSPDLRLSELSASQDSLYKPVLRLTGKLLAPGFLGQKVRLQIKCEGRDVYETIIVPRKTLHPFDVTFETPFTGFHRYEARIDPLPQERYVENNTSVFGAEAYDRKIRVIYMEGTPKAGHHLENALETDPDIEVTSFFFPQTRGNFEASRKIPFAIDADGRKLYNIAHPHKGYPRTLKDMLLYDVVINSDIYREAFTQEQHNLTVSLVEEHGGGFVMVGGTTAFGSGHYDETVIDKLMPVDCYGNEGFEYGSFKLEVPAPMFDHPIMALGATRQETERIWREKFPGFSGQNTVNRAKPGARVLAFNSDDSNKYGPLVVFAVQQIGRGRTMAFTSDTTQAWGSRFHTSFGTAEDKNLYYRRFWNQAVRWLAADRIRRKGGELRLQVDQNVTTTGESLNLQIPFPPTYPDAEISLNRKLDGAASIQVELARDEVGRSWNARVQFLQEGEWIFTAKLPRPGLDPVFTYALVNVVPDTRELSSTAANLALMRELAQIGGGQLLGEDPQSWSIQIDPKGSRIIEYGRKAIWDRWWLMAGILTLLFLEWTLRRRWFLSSPAPPQA